MLICTPKDFLMTAIYGAAAWTMIVLVSWFLLYRSQNRKKKEK